MLVEGLGIKTLTTLGGGITQALGKISFRCQFGKATAIFAAYDKAKLWVESYEPGCPVSIIPCGIDDRVFVPLPTPVIDSLDPLIVCYVGSFRDVHRLDLLLRAVKRFENCKLVLVGNGTEFNNTRMLATSLGLAERVQFVGDVDQASIPGLLKACHLMWGYSDPEHWGVPIKNFEYLGCNKLVIAGSGIQDLQFIQELGFGYLLNKDSVKEAVKIFQMAHKRVSEPGFRIQSASYIREHFNWRNFEQVLAHVH